MESPPRIAHAPAACGISAIRHYHVTVTPIICDYKSKNRFYQVQIGDDAKNMLKLNQTE